MDRRFGHVSLLAACCVLLLGCESSDDDDGNGAGGPCNGEPAAVAGITAAHNSLRTSVDSATSLPPLEWSCEVAAVAQAYANELAREGCSLEHSSNGYGENLYWSSGDSDAQDAVGAWSEEVACYTYAEFPDQCTPVAGQCDSCGHYTQIVWRDSLRLGCGVARCGEAEVWVCNYDPPGNYLGEFPY